MSVIPSSNLVWPSIMALISLLVLLGRLSIYLGWSLHPFWAIYNCFKLLAILDLLLIPLLTLVYQYMKLLVCCFVHTYAFKVSSLFTHYFTTTSLLTHTSTFSFFSLLP
jgi:hypothetical protein